MVKLAAGVPPNVTLDVFNSPVPVMTTELPPDVTPVEGKTAVGCGRAMYV
jgi:hypothetical protein